MVKNKSGSTELNGKRRVSIHIEKSEPEVSPKEESVGGTGSSTSDKNAQVQKEQVEALQTELDELKSSHSETLEKLNSEIQQLKTVN